MSLEIPLGNVGVSGVTRFLVKDKDGNVKLDTGEQKNMLLDNFFLTSNTSEPTYCHVGTGTTPPQFTDTTLETKLGGASGLASTGAASFNEVTDPVNGYVVSTAERVFTFAIGAVIGNISEYGLNNSSSSDTGLKVRNLIKDSNGDPTTISLTANDQLIVTWRMRKHLPGSAQMLADEVAVPVTLNGVLTNVTVSTINPIQMAGQVNKYAVPYFEDNLYFKRVVSVSDPDALALYNCSAGDDFPAGSLFPSEVKSATSKANSNPSPGVFKATYSVNWGLGPSYSTVATTKFISVDDYNSDNGFTTQTKMIVRFDPEFIVGTDKTLSVSFSYTVTRA